MRYFLEDPLFLEKPLLESPNNSVEEYEFRVDNNFYMYVQ
jgi:hypothetical protein